MKRIEILGPVDKRAIVYPLFKACDVLGKVLVISDDSNLRRFADKYEKEFTVGRSDFIILPEVTKETVAELSVKFAGYDYVLLVTVNTIFDDCDCIVYCHGAGQLYCNEDVLEGLEEIAHKDVVISAQKPKEKGETFLSIEGKGLKYIWDCEESKMFLPCNHADIGKLSSLLFAEVVGASSEDYGKYLVKEV